MVDCIIAHNFFLQLPVGPHPAGGLEFHPTNPGVGHGFAVANDL